MMESRFESAKLYLIDLLRAYGHRMIIVKIKQDGEEVEVMARTFVKRQLTAAGIEFPYNETNKRCSKIINTDLDNDELSIIFHRAVFEIETAYVVGLRENKSGLIAPFLIMRQKRLSHSLKRVKRKNLNWELCLKDYMLLRKM